MEVYLYFDIYVKITCNTGIRTRIKADWKENEVFALLLCYGHTIIYVMRVLYYLFSANLLAGDTLQFLN